MFSRHRCRVQILMHSCICADKIWLKHVTCGIQLVYVKIEWKLHVWVRLCRYYACNGTCIRAQIWVHCFTIHISLQNYQDGASVITDSRLTTWTRYLWLLCPMYFPCITSLRCFIVIASQGNKNCCQIWVPGKNFGGYVVNYSTASRISMVIKIQIFDCLLK